jgi:hypothetical protein
LNGFRDITVMHSFCWHWLGCFGRSYCLGDATQICKARNDYVCVSFAVAAERS